MKLITWNLNSMRARLDRLLKLLERHRPDAVCLQELKLSDAEFPDVEIRAAGYHAAWRGQKTYNGVAILGRDPPLDVERDFADGEDDPQARFLAATVSGIRILCAYVPNGQEVGSPAFTYKLQWLDRLRAYLDRCCDPAQLLALCGDMNVAPEPRDVYDPAAWEGQILFHPEERAALSRVAAWGLVDAFRLQHPEPGLYSWWDYRMLAFPKNRGLRIDHVLVTRPLAERCTAAAIDRAERKGEKPSDHAPVVVQFGESADPPKR
jgi:exodeoxyribonuclease-3